MDIEKSIKNSIFSEEKIWLCPCNGCKKARKKAFKEVIDILDGGGDAYTRIQKITKLVNEK